MKQSASSNLSSHFYAMSLHQQSVDHPSYFQQALLNFSTALSTALHLKTRYLFTRHNRLRLRYSVSAAAGVALILGLYAGGGINPSAQDDMSPEIVAQLEPASGLTSDTGNLLSYMGNPGAVASNLLSGALLNDHRDANGQIRRDPSVKESVQLTERVDESAAPEERRIKVGKGQSLAATLASADVPEDEAKQVMNAVSKQFDMRKLRQGQELNLVLEPASTTTGYQLASLNFAPDPLQTIQVSRDDDGDIVADLDKKKVKQIREARRVDIRGSFHGSADKADLPNRVTANAIKLFSYAVDFQRDVRTGDRLDVLYDSYKTDDGYVARTGDIIFARLKSRGREYSLYRYENSSGKVDYYTAEGKSIRKSSGLMKTPVAFGRLTSGFGYRRHPVLGYTKLHTGVDFGAPIGTAVYAAADGVIEKAGRFSSYGNYIRLRHSAKMSTAYAHLSRYGKGIRPGTRVKQGQIIGYVGNTGRSTGPHLHFEVLMNGVAVNPKSVTYAADNSLQGKDLQRFKQKVRSLGQEYVEKSGRVKLASAE